MGKRIVLLIVFLLILAACSGQSVTPTVATTKPSDTVQAASGTPLLPVDTASLAVLPTEGASSTTTDAITMTLPPTLPAVTLEAPTSTLTSTVDPNAWQSLPVIPTISQATLRIYDAGQKYHNKPHVFSKVGDCETSSGFFLTDFDLGTNAYELGTYQDLQTTIDYFSGSFARKSLVAGQGYSASSALTVLMADPKVCRANETPLLCEYRINKPSFALIMFGTNDTNNSRDAFESYMRMIINYSIKNGVVPVLVTKADNLEGDNSINAIIAKLAQEYDIPLWNFWAAVNGLPNHGLEADGAHLTYFPDNFTDPRAMQYAFPVRNLTALQVLNALMVAVNQDSE